MTVKIFACGDIVNNNGNDDFIDSQLKEIIKMCDYSICNFEAPVESQGERIPKAGPHLFQATKTVRYLKETGFSLCSLANNHIYDYGEVGLRRTLEEMQQLQLDCVGASLNAVEAYEPKIFRVKDINIGIIGACEAEFGCLSDVLSTKSGYAWINSSRIDQLVMQLRKSVDVLILYSHAGAECTPVPLPEWRDRYKYLCDLGVDAVIGHHPHVPQGIERYNNSYIVYSLGNFYFDTAGHEKKSNDSYSLILSIDEQNISDLECIYHKMVEGKTTLVSMNDVNFTLVELNRILEERNYIEAVEKMVVEYYISFYLGYYRSALRYDTEMKQNQGLLLLHNIRIDSHRYVVQRALSKLFEDGAN